MSSINGIEAVELLATASPADAEAVRKRGRKPVVERTAAQPLTINGIEGVIFGTAASGPGSTIRLDSADPALALAARKRGQRVVVVVNSAGTVVPATPEAPANVSVPTISGTLIVGQTLYATEGVWTGSPAPTFSYQWQADTAGNGTFANIGGATSNTYLLTASEAGDDVRVVVTATNGVPPDASANSVATDTIAAVDTTPASFSFTDVTDATVSTLYESNTITVSGTNSPATVTITGGEYSKNGGSYTSAAGTADSGDTFRVRHTSSGSASTATNTVLTIGGVSDTYTTTTAAAADTTPDAFTFTDITDATVSTLYTSNTITVTGINASTAVTITGGEYSKNGGAYTSSAGTAVVNDTFAVRHTSSGSNSTATNTVLTIGGVSDTYTTTTEAAAGDWWEDSDYDDLAVVADFNNDRYALPELGSELISNGDFPTNTTGWTPASATLSVVSGKMRVTATGSADSKAAQTITGLTTGNLYYFSCEVTPQIADKARIRANTVNVTYSSGTATQTLTMTFVATATEAVISLEAASAGAWVASGEYATFDNVTVKEVTLTASGGVYPKRSATFDEVFAYTAASTAARTYTDSAGLLQNMNINLIYPSKPTSSSSDVIANATRTFDQLTGPTGELLNKFLETSSTGEHGVYAALNSTAPVGVIAGADYTASMVVKAEGRTKARLRLFGPAFTPNIYAEFDLTAGTVLTQATASGAGTAATNSATIEDLDNGFFRIAVAGRFTANTSAYMGLHSLDSSGTLSFAGDTAKGLYWGMFQLQAGTVASYYAPTTSGSAGVNARRMTYANAKQQLRLENAGTNLCIRSQEFDNAYWSPTNATVSANSVAAPDGTTTADTITTTTAAGMVFKNTLAVTAATHTLSIYAKALATNYLMIVAGDAFTYASVVFQLTGSGTVTQSLNNTWTIVSSSVTSVGSGWYRCTVTYTPNGTNVNPLFQPCATGTPALNANGFTNAAGIGSSCYLWGAQLELSAFATDYIPTTSAAVTRAIETCRMSPLVEAILARTAASVVARVQDLKQAATYQTLVGGGGNNDGYLTRYGGGVATHIYAGNGAGWLGANSGANVYGIALGAAMGFDAAGRSVVAQGGTAATDAIAHANRTAAYLGRVPTPDANNTASIYFDFLGISPERLSNATLQALAVAA
jgi:hypothetical protein